MRAQQLDGRLGAADAPQNIDTLKGEIGGLFKVVDQQITDLATLRDEVRGLIEKWKTLNAGSPSLAPQFTAEKPVVADHIGASTFIEKGWSKISLGDYEGAELALVKALE